MSSTLFAIGDIHGCFGKLRRLIKACEAHRGRRPARYVFLGDYIDRGPQSRGVVEFLLRFQRERSDEVVCLRGNHEAMALAAHDHDGDLPIWLGNGGQATRISYWRTRGWMPDEHRDWLARLPLCHDDGLRFYVHAGVDLTRPLDQQSAHDLLWMREPFLTDSDRVDCGRFIVHGHSPLMGGAPDLRPHRVNLDTGAVFGGPLTAAVFDETQGRPRGFLTDRGSLLARLSARLRR
jgi:serine/threonine protein phosphatase 1